MEAELVDRMQCNRFIRAYRHSLRPGLGMVQIAVCRLEPAAATLKSARWGIAVPAKPRSIFATANNRPGRCKNPATMDRSIRRQMRRYQRGNWGSCRQSVEGT